MKEGCPSLTRAVCGQSLLPYQLPLEPAPAVVDGLRLHASSKLERACNRCVNQRAACDILHLLATGAHCNIKSQTKDCIGMPTSMHR